MPVLDENLIRYALSLPTSNPASLMTSYRESVPMVGAGAVKLLARKTDPQEIGKALLTFQQQLAARNGGAAEGGSPSYRGLVFGDTPGGAQSAWLNLRGQNIAAAEAEQRRIDALNEAAARRQEAASQNWINNVFRNQEMQRLLSNDQWSRQQQEQEVALRRALGIGNIEADLVRARAAATPPDLTEILNLQSIAPVLQSAENRNASAIDKVLADVSNNARQVAMANNLLVRMNDAGEPVFNYLDTRNLPPDAAATLLRAEDSSWQAPGSNGAVRDLRAELNNLLQEQARLDAGQQTYKNDLSVALRTLNQRRNETTVPAELTALLNALRAGPQAAPTYATAAQRLLAERGAAVSPSTNPAVRAVAPLPKPTKWVYRDGRIIRG